MAGTKINDLVELLTAETLDLIPIVDVSDNTMSATGSTKFITFENAILNVIATEISNKADINPYVDFSIFIPYEKPTLIFESNIFVAGLTASDAIIVNIGNFTQDSENEIDTFNITSISPVVSFENIKITLTFLQPTHGTINLKWKKI